MFQSGRIKLIRFEQTFGQESRNISEVGSSKTEYMFWAEKKNTPIPKFG